MNYQDNIEEYPDFKNWITRNRYLFNIFDLFLGQEKIKEYYTNLESLNDVDTFNNVFMKIYIYVFIIYILKENIDKEKINEINIKISPQLITMNEIKERIKIFVNENIGDIENLDEKINTYMGGIQTLDIKPIAGERFRNAVKVWDTVIKNRSNPGQ